MPDLGKRPSLRQFLGHVPAETVGTRDCADRPSSDKPDLYAEHKNCFWLVDNLNDVLSERNSKVDIQDMVRRVLVAVTTHFRHEEQLFVQYGYLDGPRHRTLHSEILAEYRRLSDELDKAALPVVWIECGSYIGRMLEEHLTEEQVIYGT